MRAVHRGEEDDEEEGAALLDEMGQTIRPRPAATCSRREDVKHAGHRV